MKINRDRLLGILCCNQFFIFLITLSYGVFNKAQLTEVQQFIFTNIDKLPL